MQNLKTVNHRCFGLRNDTSPLTAVAWDLSNDSLICAYGPTATSSVLTLARPSAQLDDAASPTKIAQWDALHPSPESNEIERIIDLHHFADDSTIVVILAGGDIVVVKEDFDLNPVEIVGSVDAGITAASWSPDEELLFITTGDDKALVMTRTFDSTASITFAVEDVRVSNHVSVGWGKSETQFKGRGAKALRDPTIPEHFDSGILNETDNGVVTISWRGDGQYIAVNSILETEPRRRIIRVYSREGVLESVSEPVDGMGSALSWKLSGQTIVSVQRIKNGAQVIFFERNGLRHGEFDLRPTQSDLESYRDVQLRWNHDSTVLAVQLNDTLQLWTTSNYHWYLKQSIRLSPLSPAITVVWHPEKPLHLACSGSTNALHQVQYSLQFSLGPVQPPHDLGIVASIDGDRLAITPLRIANIPPPMVYDQIELEAHARDVVISSTGSRIAVLHADQVSFYDCTYQDKSKPKAVFHAKFSLDLKKGDGMQLYPVRVHLLSDDTIEVLAASTSGNQWLSTRMNDRGQTTRSDQVAITPPISTISVANVDQFTANGIHDLHSPDKVHNLPPTCTSVQVWQSSGSEIIFGTTASGVLHIQSSNQHLKILGCTSYLVGHSHLMFTTSQHMLKFVHLHAGEIEIPPDTPDKDERCRMVERGAKIVTVMPTTYALVLQMPRGNLETIYPRALVLAGIRQNLQARNYRKAFMICRNHRVDMNILYDYAPTQFLRDVELFIKQIGKAEYIDLFLSSLAEEDTSATTYKETLISSTSQPFSKANSAVFKVNTICDAFLTVLSKELSAHRQSTITAHVSKNPPDLEAGLRLVSSLQGSSTEDELKEAVEHICFLSDVNLLYDTALGMYELDVTLLVAQQSQKDPREYLPYLQSLRDMEDLRRRYTIDNDLKRYNKAVGHLYALDAFDELTRYIQRHELYAQAMELYRHDKARLHDLMRLYGDFLVSRNRYSDGAVAYEYVQDFEAAYQAYQSANMWRETLATAMLVPLSEDDLSQLAQNLADSLEEVKDFSSAAVIHLEHLANVKTAARLQCKAYRFAEAIRLAVLRKEPGLLAEVIDPGLVECSAAMTELLAEMKGQINAQVPRLRELRVKKVEEPMAYLDAAEGEGGDVPDNLSVAPTDASTSGGTFMTRYTNRSQGTLATNATRRTSRNRRREERKRAQGKKGTVYEEEYLVNSITRLIERLNTVSDDVTSLVQGLMRRTMRERAVAVQNAFIEVEQLCQSHMAEVFQLSQTENNGNAQPASTEEGYRPTGGDGVLWDSVTASSRMVEPPKLKTFERSTLVVGR